MTERKQKEKTAERVGKPAWATPTDENIVPIGKKPVINYVVTCLTFFNSGTTRVVVKV